MARRTRAASGSGTANVIELASHLPKSGAVLATVAKIGEGEVVLDVDGRRETAVVAVPGYVPRVGDRVVSVRGERDGWFVLGVVGSAGVRSIHTNDGASAELERDEGGAQWLRVRDPGGRLLLEYDAARGRVVLNAGEGDLELRAGGNVTVASGRSVRFHADESVEMSAERSVAMRHGTSAVSLNAQGMSLESAHIGAVAQDASVHVERGSLVAKTVETTVEVARQIAGVIETRAGRIVERAKDVYAEIEGLIQTHAGRVRMVADDTVHVQGNRTLLKAREDMKLKGQKIHLG